MTERGRGQYEISYQPVIKGRNQLHIRVGGLNIRGSPFDVMVVPPVKVLGVPIQIFTIGGFQKPRGAAFNHAGEIVISAKNCVSILGSNSDHFGTRGSGPRQFLDPMGVAVDDEGNILVADDNHRIQKFTLKMANSLVPKVLDQSS